MKLALIAVASLAAVGCASRGTAEDYQWSAEAPKTVDKGSEFHLTVNALKAPPPDSPPEVGASAVGGVEYRWQILWTGGSPAPLRHTAWTGEPVKIRARLEPGPATVLITSRNKEGLDVKVLETRVEVK
jgi:hypothetical protein